MSGAAPQTADVLVLNLAAQAGVCRFGRRHHATVSAADPGPGLTGAENPGPADFAYEIELGITAPALDQKAIAAGDAARWQPLRGAGFASDTASGQPDGRPEPRRSRSRCACAPMPGCSPQGRLGQSVSEPGPISARTPATLLGAMPMPSETPPTALAAQLLRFRQHACSPASCCSIRWWPSTRTSSTRSWRACPAASG